MRLSLQYQYSCLTASYLSNHYLKENGNCLFDENLSVLELSSVNTVKEWSIDEIICNTTIFVDTVLIYISGFIMRTIIKKEKCTMCYTYLKESTNRVSCPLITAKQLGGLVYPISDVVEIVKLANRKVKLCTLFFTTNFEIVAIFIEISLI